VSLELKDFRGKITVEADSMLEAINRCTGKDKSEIVRDILHKWAMEQINVARVADQLLRREGAAGITGDSQGATGK
jgi:hypothetical protein